MADRASLLRFFYVLNAAPSLYASKHHPWTLCSVVSKKPNRTRLHFLELRSCFRNNGYGGSCRGTRSVYSKGRLALLQQKRNIQDHAVVESVTDSQETIVESCLAYLHRKTTSHPGPINGKGFHTFGQVSSCGGAQLQQLINWYKKCAAVQHEIQGQ